MFGRPLLDIRIVFYACFTYFCIFPHFAHILANCSCIRALFRLLRISKGAGALEYNPRQCFSRGLSSCYNLSLQQAGAGKCSNTVKTTTFSIFSSQRHEGKTTYCITLSLGMLRRVSYASAIIMSPWLQVHSWNLEENAGGSGAVDAECTCIVLEYMNVLVVNWTWLLSLCSILSLRSRESPLGSALLLWLLLVGW